MSASSSSPGRRFKRPKCRTNSTTNPTSVKTSNNDGPKSKPLCPLLAKDSEWLDITPVAHDAVSSGKPLAGPDEEEVLKLVDCEDGPEMKPLAIMFPDLLEKDPQTLQGVLDKVMSTTEVTKHLVDLGQKANFTFMKKANRLIPRDKQWMESLAEDTNSHCSIESDVFNSNLSSDYDADNEDGEYHDEPSLKVKIRSKYRQGAPGKGPSNEGQKTEVPIDMVTTSSSLHNREHKEKKTVVKWSPHIDVQTKRSIVESIEKIEKTTEPTIWIRNEDSNLASENTK